MQNGKVFLIYNINNNTHALIGILIYNDGQMDSNLTL